jgi:hypothetical protein
MQRFGQSAVIVGTMLVILGYGILPLMTALGVVTVAVGATVWWKA